jgi:hypothetical protein
MMWRCDLQESTGAIQEAYSDLEGVPLIKDCKPTPSLPSSAAGLRVVGFFLWSTIANLALW